MLLETGYGSWHCCCRHGGRSGSWKSLTWQASGGSRWGRSPSGMQHSRVGIMFWQDCTAPVLDHDSSEGSKDDSDNQWQLRMCCEWVCVLCVVRCCGGPLWRACNAEWRWAEISGGQSVSNCTMGGPICEMEPFLLHIYIDLVPICKFGMSNKAFWPILTKKKTIFDLLVVYLLATKTMV